MKYNLSKFGVSFHKSRLDNGIGVFLFSKKGLPITVRTSFFSGARFDTTPGIAHFLEHMLVAGTKRYQTKEQISRPLEMVGGHFMASTGKDFIRISINIPVKEDLDIGLKVLGEMLINSLFEDRIIENERGSIISEIERSENEHNRVLGEILYKCMFRNSDLANHIPGSIDSVKTITKSDLIDFKNKFIHTGRAIILISGDISMAECLPLLNKRLVSLNSGNKFEAPSEIITLSENKMAARPFHNNKTIYLMAGFRALSMLKNEKDTLLLGLISWILGQGKTSRLVKALRYKNGLTYSAGSSMQEYFDASVLIASTSFSKEKFGEGLKTFISELKKIGEQGLTQEELEFAKSAIIKSSFNAMQTSVSWLNVHEYEMMFNPKLSRTIDHYMNEIDSITLEEVNGVAKKYITKDNFHLALCGTDEVPSIKW